MQAICTGLSVPYVNRNLQQMRDEGFIRLGNGELEILDPHTDSVYRPKIRLPSMRDLGPSPARARAAFTSTTVDPGPQAWRADWVG